VDYVSKTKTSRPARTKISTPGDPGADKIALESTEIDTEDELEFELDADWMASMVNVRLHRIVCEKWVGRCGSQSYRSLRSSIIRMIMSEVKCSLIIGTPMDSWPQLKWEGTGSSQQMEVHLANGRNGLWGLITMHL